MRIGDMAVGSQVYLNVSGVQTAFRVMHHGRPSADYDDSWTGGTVLILDWTEPTVSYKMQVNYPSKKPYSETSMHKWLNETWLGYLDADLIQQVREVRVPYRTCVKGDPYDVAVGADGLAAKVWLPSVVEVARGSAYQSNQSTFYVTEGAAFDYWKGATAQQYADWACLDASGTDVGWATRTQNKPYYGTGSTCFNQVGQDGLCFNGGEQAVLARPCLVVSDEMPVVGGQVSAAGNFPVKVGGAWCDGTACVKVDGVWNPTATGAVRVDGVWKE